MNHNRKRSFFLYTIFLSFFLWSAFTSNAQTNTIAQARAFTAQKEFPKAIAIYKQLHEQSPLDVTVYSEYLDVLMQQHEWKDVQKLVAKQMKLHTYDPMLFIDLGKVYQASGKEKKANEQYEQAISIMNGDEMLTTKMVSAFIDLGKEEYAIQTYERASQLLRDPYIYCNALARLYDKKGETEKAVDVLLSAGPRPIGREDDTKTTLLEMLGNNKKKLQQTQKAVIKKINEYPQNTYYAELLTWLYTQKDDWEGALIQIQAVDARNKQNGQRVLAFAKLAKKEKKYTVAIDALQSIMENGKEDPLYATALAEKLAIEMLQLEQNATFTQNDIAKIEKEYEQYFTDFPQFTATETLLQYATLEAQYAGNIQKAITLLEHAITYPTANKDFIGNAKLQLGDYQLLQGKIWEASLTYSQVDKAFKEDMLGEEARFRNAKLAYYRGDFKWAQEQLDVLKASTSELISNDALSLSVLITENIPPDSNLVPLQQFAHADLLLFQNKDAAAKKLLDSIVQAFPQHPLNDDILMLRATIAIKHREYEKALAYYKTVFEKYGQDVLGDDAVFKTAALYENYLHQPATARRYYEDLILKYPGSTYVQIARKKLAENAAEAL